MTDPGEGVREIARAKLNLRLRVLGRGEDGFHVLETIFLRLALADAVEVRSAEAGIELTVEHAPPEDVPAAGAEDRHGTAAGDGQGSLFDDAVAGDAGAAGAASGDGDDDGPGDVEDGAPEDGGEDGGEGGPTDGGGRNDDPGGDDGDPGGESRAARVPEGPENLCWRAAELFHEAAGRDPGLALRLVKRVPAGAGLGGGSADAAAVLRALSRLHDAPLRREELFDLAGELGSDVPFALADVPAALGWERGRRLLPLEAPPPRPMLLVVPEVRVSTPDAYGWLDEAREGGGGPAGAGAASLPAPGELSAWEGLLPTAVNDFEEPVFGRHPQLGWWKEELLGEGAEAAMLCGSGSALCGIFGDARRRDAAADRLREGGEVRVIPTRGPV